MGIWQRSGEARSCSESPRIPRSFQLRGWPSRCPPPGRRSPPPPQPGISKILNEVVQMKIILVGVSCVGKSTTGKMLAERLGYDFFDFDFEIENYFKSHISILKKDFFTEHSFRNKACIVLTRILENNEDNFVIAMPPSGLMDYYWRIIKKDESIITIALKDKATNIFKRLRFYDDYSKPIEFKIPKAKEKAYLKDISLDIEYFGRTYKRAKIKYDICGKSAFQTADDLYELLSG